MTEVTGAMVEAKTITLSQLQAAHVARQEEWCPDQKPDLSFRGNEMAGETGEACNVIKKLERERQGWRGSRATKEQLASELADVIHTAVLCAITAGIDIAPAVVAKFNETSEKNGLSSRLTAALSARETQEPVAWKGPSIEINRELGLTSFFVEDVAYVARALGKPHWIDALHAMDDNRLIGIQFWSAPEAHPAADASRDYDSEDMTTAYMAGVEAGKDAPREAIRREAFEEGKRAGFEEAAKIAETVGNFGDYQRHELTSDYGQPKFDMMHSIATAIREAGRRAQETAVKDDLVEAVARAICRAETLPPYMPEQAWASNEDDFRQAAQAALSAISQAGCVCVSATWLEELVGDQVYSAYAEGYERGGDWNGDAMKSSRNFRDDLGLSAGWHRADDVKAMLPAEVARRIAAGRLDTATPSTKEST